MGILGKIFGRSVKKPLQELDQILSGLEKGNLHCRAAHDKIARLSKLFAIENWHSASESRIYRGKQASKAAGAHNLIRELLHMTSFENEDLRSFHFARIILNEHLPGYCMNKYWGELVSRRGPIESLWKCICRTCGFVYPSANVSEFVVDLALFCESCGDMVMVQLDHFEMRRAKRCKCGGRLRHYMSDACPRCGGGSIDSVSVSPYAYFQSHSHHTSQELLSQGKWPDLNGAH